MRNVAEKRALIHSLYKKESVPKSPSVPHCREQKIHALEIDKEALNSDTATRPESGRCARGPFIISLPNPPFLALICNTGLEPCEHFFFADGINIRHCQ